jgi:hypothetical protein
MVNEHVDQADDRAKPDDILTAILDDAEAIEHRDQGFEAGLRRMIAKACRNATEDDGEASGEPSQFDLPGFKEPKRVAVPLDESGDYEYVRFGALTKPDLGKAHLERKENHRRVARRLEDFEKKLDVLLPRMTDDEITVAEVLRS